MVHLISIWKIEKDLPDTLPVKIELPLGSTITKYIFNSQRRFFKNSGLLYKGKPLFVEVLNKE
jgi:hypothetical protein